ncbi:hypothetical protein H8D30_02465 [bacterium]|nr:hypothetical protein [bacterium]
MVLGVYPVHVPGFTPWSYLSPQPLPFGTWVKVPFGNRTVWGIVSREGAQDDGQKLKEILEVGPRLSPARRRFLSLSGEALIEPGDFSSLLLPKEGPMEGEKGEGNQEVWVAPSVGGVKRWAPKGAFLAGKQSWRAAAEGKGGVFVGTDAILGLPFTSLKKVVILEPGHGGHCRLFRAPFRDGRRLGAMAARAYGVPLEKMGQPLPLADFLENEGEGTGSSPWVRGEAVELPVGLTGRSKWLRRLIRQGKKVALWTASRGVGPLWCTRCEDVVRCQRCGSALLERAGWRVGCLLCRRDWPPLSRCPLDGTRLQKSKGGIDTVKAWADRVLPAKSVTVIGQDTLAKKRARKRAFLEGEKPFLITTDFETILSLGADVIRWVPNARSHLSGRDAFALEQGWWRLMALRQSCTAEDTALYLGVGKRIPTAIQSVLEGDAGIHWREEKEIRKLMSLPPFGEMLVLFVSERAGEVPEVILENHPDWWDKKKGWITGPKRRFGAVVLRGHPLLPQSTIESAKAWVDRVRGEVRLFYIPKGICSE